MSNYGLGRQWRAAVATLLLLTACAGISVYWLASRDTALGGAGALDPCGGPDHPCRMADVQTAARTRTAELADQVMARITSPGDGDAAVAWLATQPDVVSVAAGPDALRFRVRGGRGHWILLQTLGAAATLGGGMPPRPAISLMTAAADHASASGAAETPQSLPPRDRRIKRALLLSPFRWQWELTGASDGLDDVAARLRARDYAGTVELRVERLDPDNPNCARGAVRWPKCRTIGELSLDSFSIWGDYDYIHLVSHGGAVLQGGRSLTAVMTPWTIESIQAAREVWEKAPDSEGRTASMHFLNALGLETASVHGVALAVEPDQIPWLGRGQRRWSSDAPLQAIREAEHRAFVNDETVPLNPALKPEEAQYCQRSLETMSDSRRIDSGETRWMTPDGTKPCARYPGERAGTGNFVMLSSEFFRATYRSGLDNAVVLLSACSVGLSDDLLNALKGTETAVISWNASVTIAAAAEAGKLIAAMLVEVDESVEGDSGLTVGQVMTKVRRLIDDARSNPPTDAECQEHGPDPATAARCAARFGEVLGVINDRPADPITGASLRVVGDEDVRAREVVYLIGRSGDELRDGSIMRIVRAAEPSASRAAEHGSLDLTLRVDGLELERSPETVALEVAIDGRRIAVTEPLNQQLADGVWQLRHRLPLDREYRSGEVVDLEVRGVMAGGRESHWTYRDIRLVESWWEVTVTGARSAFPVLSGRRVQRQMHAIVGLSDGPRPGLSALPDLSIAMRIGRPPVEGANTGSITVRFRDPDYTCSGFAGTGAMSLTLESVDPLAGRFEGPVICTPKTPDPATFRDALQNHITAYAVGEFRGR